MEGMEMNKVYLIGHLGGHPEVKTTASGYQVGKASLAVSDPYKNKQTNEWEERTYWLRVTAWSKTAERLAECQKGDKVLVEGKITTGSYEDKNGETRYTTEIVADRVHRMLKRQAAGAQEPAGRSGEEQMGQPYNHDPFQVSANAPAPTVSEPVPSWVNEPTGQPDFDFQG
jgi:single-strand DNA-binding protein